jgi:lysozyme
MLLNMTYSKNAPAFAASFEGYAPFSVHHPEDPENVWTMGFGSTFWNGKPVVAGMQCTRDEALEQLGKGLEGAAQCVNMGVDVVITQPMFDACTDLIYNIGCTRWMGSTARARLNAGDYHGAASAFEMWNMAGGHVMAGLLRRRVAEEALFNTPNAATIT